MAESNLTRESSSDIQWYEDDIPVRGCLFSLPQVKAAYRELQILVKREGDRIVDALIKPEDLSEEEFSGRNKFLKEDAFKLTVSVIGFDGQTVYGETEEVFDSKSLPFPIKTIYFTNVNSFKRHSNGGVPPNRFELWLAFDKPPLFDPNPLVSEPTENGSHVVIAADDLGFYRAAQNIVAKRLNSSKKWYSFIHEKFAYDVGLWLVALPYALYWVTKLSDYFAPEGSGTSSFWIACFIYGMGVSLICYRALFGYLKWAFPLNLLEENSDRAAQHRVLLGAIVVGLLIAFIYSVLTTVPLA